MNCKKIPSLFFATFLTSSFTASSITMVMTVDWEGRVITEDNLKVISDFRARHKEIPMVHFLNPAYFTKVGADQEQLVSQMQSVLREGDDQGLHIHAWKSLLTHCQLPYKSSPNFSGRSEVCSSGDCGHTVSLEFAYSENELDQLVACSKNMLLDAGFYPVTSFRAGGWQLGPKLTQALVDNGMTFDSSQTDAKYLYEQWGRDSSLVKAVEELFPHASVLDQPYNLAGNLVEYPDNGNLADYTPPEVLLASFKQLVQANREYMVIGFHQETAPKYLLRLEKGLELIEKYAKKNNIPLRWSIR